jgi:photosystem II stability/assembly factor-like uncharacterized protein
MPFNPDDAEDVAAVGQFVAAEVKKALDAARAERENAAATGDRASVVGVPDVDPQAGPEFYVHLADGTVVTSYDAGSTHMPGKDGEPVQVIGRYQVGG